MDKLALTEYVTEYETTKYKACPPAETVERLRAILRNNGIETEETWIDSGIEEICSVRVTVKGTAIGQNGKGTNREYALASGLAEFTERLQTGYLFPEETCAPFDRAWMEPRTLGEAGGALLGETLRSIRQADGEDYDAAALEAYLDPWRFDARDGRMAVIPFRERKTGRTRYLPESILRAYYFTNGSCAGNTREEAMIQGLSEIAERYASLRIMSGRLTPPLIPDGAFAGIPLLKKAVDAIRGTGCELRVLDASLGMGLPVVAAVLNDRRHAKTILRFGSHPRFEVALERCLTEILQGRHIDRLETAPVFDFDRDGDSTGHLNVFNFMKAALGQFPIQIYGKTPSWDYAPFAPAPETRGGQLRFLLDLYDRLDWNLYVRDCSFLGFPSFQLLVPGVSMVFNFGKARQRESLQSFRSALIRPDRWSYENQRAARRLAVGKMGYLAESSFSSLVGLPVYPKLLGLELDAGLLAGLLSLSLLDRKRAALFLSHYCYGEGGKVTGVYPLVQMLKGRMSGNVSSAMESICGERAAAEAKDVILNPEKYLPVLTCPDCEGCPSKPDCAAPQIRALCSRLIPVK